MPDVSFRLRVYGDSAESKACKTVHVVVVTPATQDHGNTVGVVFFPLLFVFVIAGSSLFVLSKLKPGTGTNWILNAPEKF